MQAQLLSKIKPIIDLQQDQLSYYMILSSQSSIETRLPQDVLFQDGVLMFQNKKPLTFYMIYAGDEDLHIDIHFQAYCQVNLIEIRVLSSNCTLHKTMKLDEGATVHAFSENLSESAKSLEDVYLQAYANCQYGYSELSDDAFEGRYHFYLDGPEANAKVRTAILSKNQENKYYEILIQHNQPMTYGQMDNYGVVKDKGRLVIDGIGTITKGQHGSSAHQTNKIMMFDESCYACANPYLYIDDYDVQASHAAAVGKMDEEHLYYLQSRGLTKKQAMQLITYGYLMPVVEVIDNDMIKKHFEQSLSKVGA